MCSQQAQLIYEIDKYNVIRRIAGSWDEFSEENETHNLATEQVIGRSLWDYVIGKDVRWLYEKLIAHVRKSGNKVVFPFRCDSPDTIRLMEMEIVPQSENTVRFVTTPVEIRQRPKQLYYNYISHGQRCHVFCCSICNRVKSENAWVQLDEALQVQRLLDSDKPLSMYGALCPECKNNMDKVLSQID